MVVVCVGFSVVVCVGFSVVVVLVVGVTGDVDFSEIGVVEGFSPGVVVSGVSMVVVFSVEVVVVGVSMVVVFSVMNNNNNNNKVYLYSNFHDMKCSVKCFTEQKLEAVLFRAQVSTKSGRLSWPPGGNIVGQYENGGKEFRNWHLGSLSAQFGSKQANDAGD